MFPVYRKKPVVRAWSSREVRDGPDKGKRKRVRLTGWKPFMHFRPTEDVIRQMFSAEGAGRIDGLAVVLGSVSGGLYVRDFDTQDGYLDWAQAHPELARRLPTVRTNRGIHVYARLPYGHRPVYRKWRAGPGRGELLGDNKHYAVLPPSQHPLGREYAWVNEPASVDDFPVLTPEQAGFIEQEERKDRERRPEAAQSNNTVCVRVSVVRESDLPTEVLERDAVMRSVPEGAGERNERIWQLARSLRALPHLADAAADDELVRDLFGLWWRLAEPVVRTKSRGVSWAAFKSAWGRALPIGGEFDRVMTGAVAGPHPTAAERYASLIPRKIASMCRALQWYAGPGPFFLSCRTAAKYCGCSHMTAADWLRRLVKDGLLELVNAEKGGRSRRKASSYTWLGEAGRASQTAEALTGLVGQLTTTSPQAVPLPPSGRATVHSGVGRMVSPSYSRHSTTEPGS